jgi:GxxExxY protein
MFVAREDAKNAKGPRMPDIEELVRLAIDCGFKIHKDLGPGLLESVYEAVLAACLTRKGLKVDRQTPIDIRYDGLVFAEGFRADLLVEGRLIVEIKSIDRLAPLHGKQVLTYLRLLKQPLGLLMNFGGATFREGVRRIVNNHTDFASSRLRVNQSSLIQATPIDQ